MNRGPKNVPDKKRRPKKINSSKILFFEALKQKLFRYCRINQWLKNIWKRSRGNSAFREWLPKTRIFSIPKGLKWVGCQVLPDFVIWIKTANMNKILQALFVLIFSQRERKERLPCVILSTEMWKIVLSVNTINALLTGKNYFYWVDAIKNGPERPFYLLE